MTEWFEEWHSEYPETFLRLNKKMWIQRRDITQTDIGYISMSRKVTQEEYTSIIDREYEISQILVELQAINEYKIGYDAALILLGESESV